MASRFRPLMLLPPLLFAAFAGVASVVSLSRLAVRPGAV